MKNKRSTFCIAPFVALNTRGHGNMRVCCSISKMEHGVPKNSTVDQNNKIADLDPRGYHSEGEFYNLTRDSIDEAWNSTFYKDIRKKMLNNEYISNCEFCYRMEDNGLPSKRNGRNYFFLGNTSGNFDNLDPQHPNYQRQLETKKLIEDTQRNDGVVSSPPRWLEIRFSTTCNLRCVMCSPTLSTALYDEYEANYENLNSRMRGSLHAAKKIGASGQLRDSEYFMKQIKELSENCLYFEFRGGEILQDKVLLEFITTLSESPNAPQMHLDITTNGIGLNEKHTQMFNKFGGGTFKMSIDAFGEENEHIRYPSKWPVTVRGFEKLKYLHKGWETIIQPTITVFQALTIPRLIHFLDSYAKKELPRLCVYITMVRMVEHMRHNLIPLELREPVSKEITDFIPNSFLCSEDSPAHVINRISLKGLASALLEPQSHTPETIQLLMSQIESYKKIRNQDFYQTFPHLHELRNLLVKEEQPLGMEKG